VVGRQTAPRTMGSVPRERRTGGAQRGWAAQGEVGWHEEKPDGARGSQAGGV
jgi:hypothetical protein